MHQNVKLAAFIVSELLRENQQGSKITPFPHPDYGEGNLSEITNFYSPLNHQKIEFV